jgi:glucokinase
MDRYPLGFDIGGTKCAVVPERIENDRVHFVEKLAFAPMSGPEQTLAALRKMAIFVASRREDAVALKVVNICAKRLGRGLAFLIDILNPKRIVIGSIFARQQDRLWPSAKTTLHEEALDSSLAACRIVPSELGDAIGDYAASPTALCI